jgi:hypothetical protein
VYRRDISSDPVTLWFINFQGVLRIDAAEEFMLHLVETVDSNCGIISACFKYPFFQILHTVLHAERFPHDGPETHYF